MSGTTSKCTLCAAEICWVLTEHNKRFPLDAVPNPAGNVVLITVGGQVRGRVYGGKDLPVPDHLEAFMPHHNTCPHAAEFKRHQWQKKPKCRACGNPMDPWLPENGFHSHINCMPPIDIRTAVENAKREAQERR